MSTDFSKKLSRRLGAFFVSDRAFHKVKGGHFRFGEVLLNLDSRLAADVVKHIIYHGKSVFSERWIFDYCFGSSAEKQQAGFEKYFHSVELGHISSSIKS